MWRFPFMSFPRTASSFPPRHGGKYLPTASWMTNAVTVCLISDITYQALLLICVTGFSDRPGEVERRISCLFTERRQRLREAGLDRYYPARWWRSWKQSPFLWPPMQGCSRASSAEQIRARRAKLRRLEPAGPEPGPTPSAWACSALRVVVPMDDRAAWSPKLCSKYRWWQAEQIAGREPHAH